MRSVARFVILAVVSTMIGFQGRGLVKYGHNYLHSKAQSFSSVSSVCFKKHSTERRVNFRNDGRAVRPWECPTPMKVGEKEKRGGGEFSVDVAGRADVCSGR